MDYRRTPSFALLQLMDPLEENGATWTVKI